MKEQKGKAEKYCFIYATTNGKYNKQKKKNDHKNETKMYVKQLSEKRGGIWRKDIKVTSIQ